MKIENFQGLIKNPAKLRFAARKIKADKNFVFVASKFIILTDFSTALLKNKNFLAAVG
ncbi:hypothetical protein [Methanobacterium oryzae]|uniref:hypothetical protein n=1 Tax=Methanobacterium oryzae TaxID=69540 RepID=UPI003D25C0AA